MISEQEFRALEARVDMLEGQRRQYAVGPTAEMVAKKYGWMLDKTQAAEMIGTTRATIYAMIADGRLKMSPDGKIPAASVARYLNGEAVYKKRGPKKKNAEDAAAGERTRLALHTIRETETRNAAHIREWERRHE